LKKRSKKLLLIWAMGVGSDTAHGPDLKSLFASFSSEKEVLCLLQAAFDCSVG
jgi:hypothetical protein